MASEPIVLVGSLRDAYDGTVSVYAQGGDVVVSITDEDGRSLMGLPPAKLAEFRELLDRAAMPGQEASHG